MRRLVPSGLPAGLRLLRALITLLSAALLVLLALSGLAASGIWDAVEKQHAPRTTSAAGLDLALNDMDAQVVNMLLASGDAGRGRLDEPYEKAAGHYADARRTIAGELRALAVAADGDRSAERTVDSLSDSYARYEELIGRALENDGRAGGKAAARADYRTATRLLSEELVPRAEELIETNNGNFEAEYVSARSTLTGQLITLAGCGVLLLAVLAALQWWLARRFRRILNPALLAAALCAVLAVVLGAQALIGEREHLRVARRDAFDSVVALSRARAIAYDANADESRYLLDPALREPYEASFYAKSRKLYGISGVPLSSYADRIDATWRAYGADHQDLRFTGEFRRELDNITFPGERVAAERTVEAYAVYQHDDVKIRRLVAQGRQREAAEFCMGWEPGTSNAHFGAWMTALDNVTEINERYFAASVSAGRSDLTGLLPWSGGALLAVAVLTYLGVRPRLAEFGSM
ncbi:hypothetical protein GTY65_00810 [Streptomyces sp. SID8379]|uniref:hypothetical protein n=1 Tax=unclassified Streptomyces TaxID=2593676 RepID=UPI000371269C|nr:MULTISPECIES: hypothetical protein [unclassified Streptomyces]MYW62625.1 hypothetical protein [Streptomyces sp. SID8379]